MGKLPILIKLMEDSQLEGEFWTNSWNVVDNQIYESAILGCGIVFLSFRR